MKTNAMRLLDKAKIKYETMEYQIAKEDFDGKRVSDLLGMDYRSCYKTLGVKSGHDIYLAVVSIDDELDLKKIAKAAGVKNVEMIHVKDLLKLHGYERGSVSPVGAKKNSGIFFDDEADNHEEIEISGGMMGIGLKVRTTDIISFLNAKVANIRKDRNEK